MAKNESPFSCLLDRRYYHFVAFRDEGRYTLPTYWRQIGVLPADPGEEDISGPVFEVQHRRVKLDRAYARGEVLRAISESKRGGPPYLYDLFAIKARFGKETFFLFLFPFAALALELTSALLGKSSLLRSGDFQKVDVSRLVKCFEGKEQTGFQDLAARIVALHFVITGDKSVSAIRLGGDDPLSAEIYRDWLRPEMQKGAALPNLCVFTCEREPSAQSDGPGPHSPGALRSRVHVDVHGIFKFYAHVGCNNISLIPYALGLLHFLQCLEKTSGNPLRRLQQEELEA